MGLKDTVNDHEAQAVTRTGTGEMPVGQVEEKAEAEK